MKSSFFSVRKLDTGNFHRNKFVLRNLNVFEMALQALSHIDQTLSVRVCVVLPFHKMNFFFFHIQTLCLFFLNLNFKTFYQIQVEKDCGTVVYLENYCVYVSLLIPNWPTENAVRHNSFHLPVVYLTSIKYNCKYI